MQSLTTGSDRSLWFLNDPIEDNPQHDWDDYRRNWQSTVVASLLHPNIWQYEVAPWPERILTGRYPRRAKKDDRKRIPADYATVLQIVMNAMNDMEHRSIEWDCGLEQVGVIVSDSMMFQRGDPHPSHPD